MPRGTEHEPKTTWPPNEHTMTTVTESKLLQGDPIKLKAALDDPGKSTLGIITAMRPSFLSVLHDARIAHEQREVIRKLVAALRPIALCSIEADEAIEAARPYLEA